MCLVFFVNGENDNFGFTCRFFCCSERKHMNTKKRGNKSKILEKKHEQFFVLKGGSSKKHKGKEDVGEKVWRLRFYLFLHFGFKKKKKKRKIIKIKTLIIFERQHHPKGHPQQQAPPERKRGR